MERCGHAIDTEQCRGARHRRRDGAIAASDGEERISAADRTSLLAAYHSVVALRQRYAVPPLNAPPAAP
ncbi:MAG TPA: hypothetical protein VHT04_17165 [Stellaceae bacterium]|nr:hypothetical protein [Stellaceae bacterium]